MVKKTYEEEIQEDDNCDSIPESDNNKSKLLRKKPWTDEEDNLVRKLV